MSQIVTMNSEILEVLRKYRINADQAKAYLLGVYFNLNTDYIDEKVKTQVNTLGILEREYAADNTTVNKIVWKVPLFNEEKDVTFGWVADWMNGFERINKSRKGTKTAVMSRMKKFFAEHPEVRVQDVFDATQAYFRTVNDPQYLKSSHKFIMEGTGFNRISMLEQYIDMQKTVGIGDGRVTKMKG